MAPGGGALSCVVPFPGDCLRIPIVESQAGLWTSKKGSASLEAVFVVMTIVTFKLVEIKVGKIEKRSQPAIRNDDLREAQLPRPLS